MSAIKGTVLNKKEIALEPGEIIKAETNFSPGEKVICFFNINNELVKVQKEKEDEFNGEYGG